MKTYLKFYDFKSRDEIVIAKESIIAIRQMQHEKHLKVFLEGGASFDIRCEMPVLHGYLKGGARNDD